MISESKIAKVEKIFKAIFEYRQKHELDCLKDLYKKLLKIRSFEKRALLEREKFFSRLAYISGAVLALLGGGMIVQAVEARSPALWILIVPVFIMGLALVGSMKVVSDKLKGFARGSAALDFLIDDPKELLFSRRRKSPFKPLYVDQTLCGIEDPFLKVEVSTDYLSKDEIVMLLEILRLRKILRGITPQVSVFSGSELVAEAASPGRAFRIWQRKSDLGILDKKKAFLKAASRLMKAFGASNWDELIRILITKYAREFLPQVLYIGAKYPFVELKAALKTGELDDSVPDSALWFEQLNAWADFYCSWIDYGSMVSPMVAVFRKELEEYASPSTLEEHVRSIGNYAALERVAEVGSKGE